MSDTLPRPSWDELFMRHAYLISSKSKDSRTRIGAVLVRGQRVISEGYNGMARGVNDNVAARYERPEKYFWFEHAERNSIYGCALHGIATGGSILYTQGIPCADCARGVIQAGIREIVIHRQWDSMMRQRAGWKESHDVSANMLQEAGVGLRDFDLVLHVQSMMDGKIVDV